MSNKNTFKPGDKFILELGAERRMFHEFEIAGTDLYVKTDLLDKLTKYEPSTQTEIKPISYTDCANAMLKMWMDNVVTDGEYNKIMDKLNSFWTERRKK
jgi:hypothetical protein